MIGNAAWLDSLRQDLRACFRQWRKHPLTAAVALATIALGTGLNTAVFRVLWSALLKPLPYPDAARLVQVWGVERADGGLLAADRRYPDGPAVEQWRSRSRSFQTLAVYRPWRVTVESGGDPEAVAAAVVSAEFLPALGAQTAVGRVFAPEEVRYGADDAVVLGYAYWQSRFGGNRNLVGNRILVDGRHCRVVGVLSPEFRDLVTSGIRPPLVYLPISKIAEGPLKVASGLVIGRLREGVAIEAARSELEALALDSRLQGVRLVKLHDEIGRAVRPALWALFAGAACLLLIACANVSGLLLAQGIGRRQEFAIRAAVGAGRPRLVRQLLTEALLLSAGGLLPGLGAGWGLYRAMVALYPGVLPRVSEGGAAGAMVLFALILAPLSAALCGVLPAVLVTRGWRGAGTPAAHRSREGLIAVQIAATAVLLIAAGLLAKSFVTLRAVDPGFEHRDLLTAQVDLSAARYPTDSHRMNFARAFLNGVKSLPGVRSAALTNTLPLGFTVLTEVQFGVSGRDGEHRAGARAVMGDYFEALALRLVEGRALTPADDGRRDVVVVNESFRHSFLGGLPAVGAVLRFGPRQAAIAGVVRDPRTLGLRRSAPPEIYMPLAALPGGILDVVIRTAVPPPEIAATVRAQLRRLDSSLALARVSPMDRIVDAEFAQPRFHAALLALMAAAALALAAVGIYGAMAQGVRSRTREFAIRAALGATRGRLFWLVVKQGSRAPLIGLGIGLAGAQPAGRLLESLLFGVTPGDPLIAAAAGALVAAVCLWSCALPAWQVSRADPARSLRHE